MATIAAGRQRGFTLIEVLIAMGIMTAGALALAGLIAFSASSALGSQGDLIASQRAAEAIESVFKSRDTRILSWNQIRNARGGTGADGGVFLDGAQSLRDAGPDGLINTADDGAVVETVTPGADGLLGTADDVRTPLNGYTREIEIRDIGPNLRQLRVIVTFRSAAGPHRFVLTTYVSAFA